MNKYCVVLCTRTSFNFKQKFIKYKFNFKIFKVTLRKITEENDKKLSGIMYGWFLEIELEAKDINSAISHSYDISELFLSLVCLETGVESHRSTIILAYDITDGISERDFIQYFYDLPISRPQQADFDIFSNHLDAVLNFDGDSKDRLYRSIRWFRKGINEDDPLDQFLALWQGLETLNPLLALHFDCENAGKDIIELKCVKTGNSFYSERTTKQGLERLVNYIELDKSIWKEINKTRNSISHGYAGFAGLYNDSIRLAPYLAKLLHEGVSLILGFEFDEKVVKQLEHIAPVKVGETYFVECKLHEEDLSKLTVGYQHPYFISENEAVPIEGGYQVTQKLHPVIGCNYTPVALAISGRGANLKLDSVE